MTVLGFDTATPATAVGLRLADGTTLRARDDPPAGARPGHTTRLLELAGELLERAELSWDELRRVAVGVGPGMFTGLRVGVATARALAQSLGAELAGVSTPDVLAEAARRAHPGRDVLAVIDARRGEAFVAAYGEGREPRPPVALAPEGMRSLPAPAGAGGWLAVGDGAVRFRARLHELGIEVPVDGAALHRVDAGLLCELALVAPATTLEGVLPDYRRRPDAELARAEGQR